MEIIQDVLIYQTQMMRNSSLGPYVLADFSPPDHIVVVNALFYASLSVMIVAAFIAMLIKSWVREFDRGLRAMSIPEQRAKTREFRYLGMERWKLPELVDMLPLLIQLSLFLFAAGLALFLFHVSKPSFGVVISIAGAAALFYAMTTTVSVFVASSPFHTPRTRTLGRLYQLVHAYLCPPAHVFLSEAMDTTPETALGCVRRYMQIVLHIWRPYLEKDFEEPITATTMDEVQLSTVASTLQRIHESTPNSEHSEELQWSVWQVAGSPVLQIPPLFRLSPWILDRCNDEEYLSALPPATQIALVAVSLRGHRNEAARSITAARAVLQRAGNPKVPWVQLVFAIFDLVCDHELPLPLYINHMRQTESNLASMIRRKELHRDESLWLLRTLAELRCEDCLFGNTPFFIEICLGILLNHATRWDYNNPPDIVLLEAVLTLAAISCSPNKPYWLNNLTSSHERPWLLLNIRNPSLVCALFGGTPSNYHKQLISLLFLVVYALLYRKSYPLAVQYFILTTAKGDLPLYISALTAIAPSISDHGLSAIGIMLVAPQKQESTRTISYSWHSMGRVIPENLLKDYDRRLGASENPDPNFFAITLMLSKHLAFYDARRLWSLDLKLKNPWLRLAARVVARLDIPDGSGLPMGLFHDHRVHNMIAALSLLRYARRDVTQFTESHLLASFLESREPAISSVALEYYMKTTISYSDSSAPPSHLSAAVSAAFNVMIPDYLQWMGWRILDTFVDGFETLSVEWRRTFAEGFFTLSRQRLPRPRGGMELNTPESELEEILTWEYFHEEEREPELTDSDFSGLDWIAMAWSLYLSQQSQSGRKIVSPGQGNAPPRNLSGPAVNEDFVLRALCKLLDAAPYHQIIPIVPKIREFVQWFDNSELSEYRRMISMRVDEAVRWHEFQRFRKFLCLWCI